MLPLILCHKAQRTLCFSNESPCVLIFCCISPVKKYLSLQLHQKIFACLSLTVLRDRERESGSGSSALMAHGLPLATQHRQPRVPYPYPLGPWGVMRATSREMQQQNASRCAVPCSQQINAMTVQSHTHARSTALPATSPACALYLNRISAQCQGTQRWNQ